MGYRDIVAGRVTRWRLLAGSPIDAGMSDFSTEPKAVARVADAGELCASCGLCCSGLLFEHVRFEPKDTVACSHIDLDAGAKQDMLVLHPCPLLEGTHCSIYQDRPTRCRDYACQTRREILNGAIDQQEASGRIATMKARLQALAETGADIVARPLQEIGFRNFCVELERIVETRIETGEPVAETERDAVFQAFEIVQQVDREFAKTRRLDRLAGLVMRAKNGE